VDENGNEYDPLQEKDPNSDTIAKVVSNIWCGTPKGPEQLPSGAPLNLSATTQAGNESILVEWDAPSNPSDPNNVIASYVLCRSTDPNFGEGNVEQIPLENQNSYVDTNVSEGERWYYEVKAVNQFGLQSEPSNRDDDIIPLPTDPPITTNLQSDLNSNDNPVLTWDSNAKDVLGDEFKCYRMYRSTTGEGGSFSLYRDNLTGTSLTDTNVGRGEDYCYYVTSVSTKGGDTLIESEPSEIICQGIPLSDPLDAPSNLVATGGNGKVDLSWDEVIGAKGYELCRSTDGTNFSVLWRTPANQVPLDLEYTDTDVINGTKYYYEVKSIDSFGQRSDPSNVADATIVIPSLNLATTSGLDMVIVQDRYIVFKAFRPDDGLLRCLDTVTSQVVSSLQLNATSFNSGNLTTNGSDRVFFVKKEGNFSRLDSFIISVDTDGNLQLLHSNNLFLSFPGRQVSATPTGAIHSSQVTQCDPIESDADYELYFHSHVTMFNIPIKNDETPSGRIVTSMGSLGVFQRGGAITQFETERIKADGSSIVIEESGTSPSNIGGRPGSRRHEWKSQNI
jgi:fibronectin type 3 domain-containing protein